MRRASLCLFVALLVAPAAIGAPPADPSALLMRAQNLMQKDASPADVERAVALLQEALRRFRQLGGNDSPDVATTLHLLGVARSASGSLGELRAARDAFAESLELRERALRQTTSAYALALGQLALAQDMLGHTASSEPLYQRLLLLQEQAYGPRSIEVASTTRHLGRIYLSQGDLERAEPLIRRALALAEAHYGKEGHLSAEVIPYTLDAAAVISWQGRTGEAAAVLTRLLGATEEAGWPPWRRSGLLAALGDLLQRRGARGEARARYQEALSSLPPGLSPNIEWLVVDQRAALHRLLGALPAAEAGYGDALTAAQRRLGDGSAEAGHARVWLAALRAARGQPDEAAALLLRSLSTSETRLRTERFAYGEARLGAYLRTLQDGEEAWAYTLLLQHPGHAGLRRLALATALLRKGRALDELASKSRTLLQETDLAVQEQLGELRALRAHLSALSLAGPGEGSVAEFQRRLSALGEQAEALERALLPRAARLRAWQAPPFDQIVARVAAALPPEGALLELVSFQPHELTALGDAPRWSGPRYLGFVLLPDGEIAARDLGPAAPIEDAARQLLRALQDPRDADGWRGPALELSRRVIWPFTPWLSPRSALVVSPDGPLNLIPFAVLPQGGAALLSRHRLSYVTAGRDLLPRAVPPRPAREAVILADPDFTAAAAPDILYGGAERDRALTDRGFAPLPGTRREAEALRRRLPGARVLLGAEASEPALLGVQAPGILHVATHGIFYEGDAAEGAPRADRGLQQTVVPPPPNPLLRAALVLAGAGRSGDGGVIRGLADGLATALEVAGMNLWGTQLVVLSACETGRGGVPRGQGVVGMRRALTLAGAETVVTSLWRVDDTATEELMVRYYDGLLAGAGRAAAMQAAAQAVQRRRPHPYYWAPFIVLGQVGPLQGLPGSAEPAIARAPVAAGAPAAPAVGTPAAAPVPTGGPPPGGPDRQIRAIWAAGPDRFYVAGRGGGIWRWDGRSWRGGPGHGGGVDLFGLWGMATATGDHLYAVGAAGTVLRFDGVSWQPQRSGTTVRLAAVWGESERCVYAVGAKGTVLRFDGSKWQQLQSGTTEDLLGIQGHGCDQVVIVGSGRTALRYDGKAFRALGEIAATSEKGPHLFSVWGPTPDRLFAASDRLLRFDGTTWTADPASPSSLRAVTGSGGAVFAVGHRARLRIDDSGLVALPRETTRELRALFPLGAGQVLAAGDDGVVLRWDGQRWRRLGGPASDNWDWQAAWGSAPDNLLVAGEDGVLQRFDGTTWRREESGTQESLTGLWGLDPKDVYAIGAHGTIRHFDGAAWSAVPSGTRAFLSGVSGDAQDVYVVGTEGTILRRRRGAPGGSFQPLAAPAEVDLNAVWTGGGAVFAVGHEAVGQGLGGVVLRGDRDRLRRDPVQVSAPLLSVWGRGPREVYVAGDGVALRFDGRSFRALATPDQWRVHALWGTAARGPVYGVGRKGVEGLLLRFDGQAFRELPLPQRVPLLLDIVGLEGGGATRLLTVGWGGTALILPVAP